MNQIDNSYSHFQLAAQFVNQTGASIFLTGKAGTGKTTFLKYIREHSFKKMAVVEKPDAFFVAFVVCGNFRFAVDHVLLYTPRFADCQSSVGGVIRAGAAIRACFLFQ